MNISIEHLKSVLRYDPETGEWTRLRSAAANTVGKRADFIAVSPANYRRISYKGKWILSHRLAFFYMRGRWPIGIDHIDRHRDNNRWVNLREANQKQNNGNHQLSKRNKAGYRGVFWNKTKKTWTAQIKLNGISTHLGYFKRIENAALAYNFAAAEYFGEFYHAPR